MAEYLVGRDGTPLGPGLDGLEEERVEQIRACIDFFSSSIERLKYFENRVRELGRNGLDTVIVLIDVDDQTGHGQILADDLMPGHDWQQYRDRGEVPVARGLASKEGFPDILLDLGYADAARELASTDELSVVVLHAGAMQVMEARFQ